MVKIEFAEIVGKDIDFGLIYTRCRDEEKR